MDKLPNNLLQRQGAVDNRVEDGARFWVTEEGLEDRRVSDENRWQAFNNGVQLYFKNTNQDLYSYLVVDSSNNFLIGNDNFGNEVYINVRATDTTQRGVSFKVDDTTKFPQISPSVTGSLRIVTVNDLYLISADAIIIDADDGIFMPDLPTSDPAQAGRLWNSGGTLKVSAG
jgi:hypothetical protein